MTSRKITRRDVVATAFAASAAATLAVLGSSPANAQSQAGSSAAPAKVNEKDSLAVALGYVADSKRVDAKANPAFKPGSTCGGCSWYQGKAGDSGGPCTFFPGKNVDANGWCKMWNKKQ